MDDKTFNMVEGILSDKTVPAAPGVEHDNRTAALDLLEEGVKQGTLGEVAQVIARRYNLRPQVVIGWYAETLNRRVKETTELIQKLTELRLKNV